jgi:cysteine-rich repeat protein
MRRVGMLCVVLILGCDGIETSQKAVAGWPNQDTAELVPACGNGVREVGEQCDDGGQVNLDGCSATCQFEQVQRVNFAQFQFTGDVTCPSNALGGAIVGSAAQAELQQSVDSAIQDGSMSVLFQLLGLDDLTGNADPIIDVGVLGGTPIAGVGYDGTLDLDWWYQVDPAMIDAQRFPLARLGGDITARVLSTQPGGLKIPVRLGGTLSTLSLSNARLSVGIGASSAPLVSSGTPPGHLASEQLDPALVSFASAGEKNAIGAGTLCGNVSASSLSQVPIPSALVSGGFLSCMEGYMASNSLLDVLVGGCRILFVRQIRPTQPDTEDPTAPPAGGGPGYRLTTNSQRQVSGCLDSSGAAADLATCLNDAAYSAYLKFATGRVIAR